MAERYSSDNQRCKGRSDHDRYRAGEMSSVSSNAALCRGRFLRLLGTVLTLITASSAQTEICQQANQFFYQHLWQQAAEAFQKCEIASPGKTDALLYRGKALVNIADFSAATSSLEEYITNQPQSDDAL